MNEQWKQIPWDSRYYISNVGQVKSYARVYERIVKPVIIKPGYLRVRIGSKKFLIHRLVALTWIPNPDNLSEVNHLNGDKKDNRVENLEWTTRLQNMQHAAKNGWMKPPCQKGEEHSQAVLTKKKVLEIRSKYATGKYKQKELAEEYKVTSATVSDVICFKSWKDVK